MIFISKRHTLILSFILVLSSVSAQDKEYSNLSSEAFSQLISNERGILLDVRTSSEFSNGHIANAGQLNFYQLNFKQKLLLLPKNNQIYLYCNTGYRSRKAAEFLHKNGYNKVYNLEYGIMEWNLKNLPVIEVETTAKEEKNKISPEAFKRLLESDKKILIDFYAPWCAPCRTMMPIIDSLKIQYNEKVTVVKINVDASKLLVKKLQISSVPYLVIYIKGEKMMEHYGTISSEVLSSYL